MNLSVAEEIARNVGPAGIEIAYERLGDPADPPVLLIMGSGVQMVAWPDGFCAALVERGLHVVRFDNRDVGRSTHLRDVPAPDLRAAMSGGPPSVPYTLADMVADTVGLLDALGLGGVHLVGASLGGMIAQMIALDHPARVRSLTSIMSTTGDPEVGRPRPEALAGLGAPPEDREGFLAWQVRAARATGSPGFAFDEAAVAARVRLSYDRGHDPAGTARQFAAVSTAGDRTGRLRSLTVPTLVVHGADDVLIGADGGRATAAAIPGAELLVIEGMGHDLPRELWPTITDRIAALVRRAESAR
ncbi:alpha/beta hydrolase [Actinomadura kijaniata]|uniref:alpha/beta hydrolase n=1 Tax=Actinomadura kijaniata TaxID=46161 RepID=UPI0008303C96|nr:alpha/beta hydrolase [Actinomadura kijaniata]